ncbi:Hypothetical predicted protein [Mytilus galloprovincialis]|uniref:Uncharacterized protein n=1 Tax=Mytilus galloprovincialis TaxID=29158 RepID=A0A8B6C6N0_MYTGA|nr:Hypothetical predicted protein [Mytilus galloprovincialis]
MADGFCERLGPSLLIISIASVCYMIGIATPYLIKIESLTSISNSGLWKRCSSSTYGKECYNTSTYAENDWFRICQVMCIFGLVAILTSTACIALRLLKLREHKVLQIATIVGVFSAVVFILIGVVLYVRNVDDITSGLDFYYGYSLAFFIGGMCLAAVVEIVLIYDLIKTKNDIRNRVKDTANKNMSF